MTPDVNVNSREVPPGNRRCRRCREAIPDDDRAERLHLQGLDRPAPSPDDPRWRGGPVAQPRRPPIRPLDEVQPWASLPW